MGENPVMEMASVAKELLAGCFRATPNSYIDAGRMKNA
jgi:hypothetical protein